MTKRCLFVSLCELADSLQAECDRLCFSPAQIALAALVTRLDVVIDQILDEGVQADAPAPFPRSLQQWRASDRRGEDDPHA